MSVNKVTAFGENLIDLTEDTVTKDALIKGVTAHDASGNSVTGTFDTDKYLEKTGDASNTTAVFSASEERANISTGEKLSVIFGKIAKFFSDLKTVAFTGKYSDLSGTPSVVSETADGLCPKNGGTTTKFLRDDGTYAVPTSSVSGLSTIEQVTAAATAGNVTAPVGAGALAEVNSSLTDQPTFEYDESGKITGYKTKIGGADTVFPFKNGADVVWTNPSPNAEMKSTVTVNFDFTKYSHIAISLKGHYSQSNNSLETQLFSTLHSGGSLRPTSTNQNYSRTMTFDKSNNTITIKPNTSAGNYESYTIPMRIWGLNIDADFSSI